MSYQALLFCPDEKTARVVSQVLTELEFSVEPCHEPFAAVKKLMAQHFDAIVVDCDNEQNAALLFKSARNSGSNQASLAVAVVEGQTGVAKAFRLGANLVLTKPIHIEQSKGTLRVARGLLRKGQAAKPAAGINSNAAAATLIAPAASAFPPPVATAQPPSLSASAFELDAEPMPPPDPADAALLEYMPDSPLSGSDNLAAGAEAGPSKQYPWQPRKPLAEPMATALRRAAEVAGNSEFDAATSRSVTTPEAVASQASAAQPLVSQASISQSRSSAGAAAAPARAREIPAPAAKKLGLEPTASAIEAPAREEIKKIEDASASQDWDSNSAVAEAPSFSSLDDSPQAAGAGGSKKTLLIAGLVLGLAAAGYFGWSKMQSAPAQPAAQQTIAPASAPAALPPQPASAAPEGQAVAGDVVAPQPGQSTSGVTAVPSSSKPSAAVVVEAPGVKSASPAKAAPAADADVTVVKTPSPALMVQNNSSIPVQADSENQDSVQAPAATSIATGTNTSALSGIVNTNAINAQKAPQQTLRISQGVSQGLVVKKVQPEYPAQARLMHLEGKVELQANITRSGSISSVKQLSGDRILGRAAIDAVRQWKYKPYYLNGDPVEVETQVTVNFKLP